MIVKALRGTGRRHVNHFEYGSDFSVVGRMMKGKASGEMGKRGYDQRSLPKAFLVKGFETLF